MTDPRIDRPQRGTRRPKLSSERPCIHANPLIELEKKVLDRFKPNRYFGKNPDGLLAGQSKTISAMDDPHR